VYTANGTEIDIGGTGVTPTLAKVLYGLVRENRLARTLEVGMGWGLSSMVICQALRDNGGGHHLAIDPWQSDTWHSIGLLNLHGWHLYDYVMLDLFYARQLVRDGGWICLDDTWMSAVSRTVAFALRNLSTIALVEQNDNYCMLRKIAAPDDRAWDHFEDF
jgi:hypothetical protein